MTSDRKRVWATLSLSIYVAGSLYFLYLNRLGDRDLWGSHEARAGQNAQRILDTGDWSVPRLFDGTPEFQKPPMYYWCVAAVGWIRGSVDAVAVRLPATLSALACIGLVFAFLAVRGRLRAGFVAAVVLATAQHFTWIGRTGRIDLALTLTTTVAIVSLWRPSSWRIALIGYFAIATGIMLKGPLGAILPGVVLLFDRVISLLRARLVETDGPDWSSLRWGLPLVVSLSVPWFAYAHSATNGDFTRVFFWYHHVQRATGGSEALASHPWWFYAVRLAVDWLPWSPLFLLAGWRFLRSSEFQADRAAQLGLAWLMGIAVLLSLSRFKRADYLLPAYPGAAIWLGCWAERLPETLVRRSAIGALAICSLAWAVSLRTIVVDLDADREKRTFATEIRALAPRPQQILMFRVEDHLLAFHLGRPVNTFLEWENLNTWVGRPGERYVVMPADCALVWRSYISTGCLDEVARWTDRTERSRPRDLVLVRTRNDLPNPNDHASNRPSKVLARPAELTTTGSQRSGDVGDDHQ
ncbi:MAG: glycosyltransferase family 39 protein [Gemmataceae bacterium]